MKKWIVPILLCLAVLVMILGVFIEKFNHDSDNYAKLYWKDKVRGDFAYADDKMYAEDVWYMDANFVDQEKIDAIGAYFEGLTYMSLSDVPDDQADFVLLMGKDGIESLHAKIYILNETQAMIVTNQKDDGIIVPKSDLEPFSLNLWRD